MVLPVAETKIVANRAEAIILIAMKTKAILLPPKNLGMARRRPEGKRRKIKI